MTGLLSLPNELLLQIVFAVSDVTTATRLCSINRRFRGVWNDKDNDIIHKHLEAWPAYDDGITLAIAETTHMIDRPKHLGPSLHVWYPVFHSNAHMCARLCKMQSQHHTQWSSQLAEPVWWDTPEVWAHMPDGYYMTRLLVLAYRHPRSLRAPVLSMLWHRSEDAKTAYFQFHAYMKRDLKDEEIQRWHDMIVPAEEQEYDLDGTPFRSRLEWDFALDMLGLYMTDYISDDEEKIGPCYKSNSSGRGNRSWW